MKGQGKCFTVDMNNGAYVSPKSLYLYGHEFKICKHSEKKNLMPS